MPTRVLSRIFCSKSQVLKTQDFNHKYGGGKPRGAKPPAKDGGESRKNLVKTKGRPRISVRLGGREVLMRERPRGETGERGETQFAGGSMRSKPLPSLTV